MHEQELFGGRVVGAGRLGGEPGQCVRSAFGRYHLGRYHLDAVKMQSSRAGSEAEGPFLWVMLVPFWPLWSGWHA